MSGRAIKLLGRCSMEITFSDVRIGDGDLTMTVRRALRTDK